MLKRLPPIAVLLTTAILRAQTVSPADIASLREDVSGLSQRVADLSLRVEQLEAENASLRAQAKSTPSDSVTTAQLNQAISELNHEIQVAKEEAVRTIEAASGPGVGQPSSRDRGTPAGGASSAASSTAFGTDFPKEGLNYKVQRGDTIASIAKKTGAKISDIINANRIADPSRIQPGQALFIPGGK